MSDAFEEFGPYAVYERLGQGGMATVHRAEKRDAGIRRPIALKRLLPHVAADPALVKLFVDEARLASHLRHANVAQTYELGKVGDTFFIAMEYASGPTLAQIIRQCLEAAGEIPLPITVNLLSQVCEALDYAHNLCDEAGRPLRIIHRDVSPANIIVTSSGIVKLIDFGIAKATISSVKTQTGFIKGKFGYIAPEYITGKIDARVDLFAVGVVAHEMMSGRRLFEGKDDFETLHNIREMNLHPPSHDNPHVTPDLDDIVMTALQRDPATRWQSAGAMQVALAHVARTFGLVVGSPQVAEWIDWAFSQLPPDAGPAISADDTDGFDRDRRPSSSLSIEISHAPADSLELTPQRELTPLPEPTPPDPPARLSSDSDATRPVERVALTTRDIELLTPSPELAPPPPAVRRSRSSQPPPVPPTPRPSLGHETVPPPVPPPIPPPRPRTAAAPPPPPMPRASRTMDAALPPPVPPSGERNLVASSRELDILAPPPAAARPTSAHAAAAASAASATSSGNETTPVPRRRSLVWLILLMIALGAGAMTAAYFWPDL
ncbi:MAG: serine/threonine protein kinase [Deltaproteobacteria bacterium]|nr:MAG: serine/threonine protein kinase [Deltaproteobacteria bacterium]